MDEIFWQSRSVGVCLVGISGDIVRANQAFLELTGLSVLENPYETGMNASAVVAELRINCSSLSIESFSAGPSGETFFILAPALQPSRLETEESSGTAFRLLHDSVAQSVAALAMNLFLVKQSGATSTSPGAEKILRASLEIVEQCAKEVRGICTLLQRQSKPAGRNCA